jgi:hypothetical protein
MYSLHKLRSLKPPERWLLLQFNHVYASLARLIGHKSQALPEDEPKRVRRARHVIRCLARNGLYGGNCLSNALVLWGLLCRQGIEGDFCIGVRRNAGQFEAHAWVEYQGRPLNATETIYQCFAAFDQPFVPEGVKFS